MSMDKHTHTHIHTHDELIDECEPTPPHNKYIIFGKYEMGRLLGQGTFAKVYSAHNTLTKELVAIKIVSKDKVEKAGMMDQIKREISIMRLIRHPNVVELKEVMATRGRIYFVMEHVKGGELFAKVAKGRLSEELARKYFQQLISAIDYCHSRGVAHRDLKPENLLLDENGDLKVTDFGLSALTEHSRQDGLLHTMCGTPAYVAPEVIRKKGYDGAKADIWSCGVILYVLMSGFLPFHDENVMRMYQQMFKADYKFPPWFPFEPSRLVAKLLVVDPKKRLSIEGIMRQPWFLKGFKVPCPIATLAMDRHEPVLSKSLSSPKFYNAFELISAMSSGFDLSGLFEGGDKMRRKVGSMFTSRCSASAVVARIEGLARKLNFRVSGSKEFRVKMEGQSEGRKGRLTVELDVFEVAANVAAVELSKCSGDTLEYVKFCEEDVRPALKDIVWAWQGEK